MSIHSLIESLNQIKSNVYRATTSEIRDEEEEDIEENTSESESNYIIVASSRSKSK
jgi:hypothetical protein